VVNHLSVDQRNCLIKVNIEDNNLRAFISVTAPFDPDFSPTYDDVMKTLTDHKVAYGIKEANIKEALQGKQWGQRILAAEGIAPVEGKDAELIYEYQTNDRFGWSNLQNAAFVDFHDLNLVKKCEKGRPPGSKNSAESELGGGGCSGDPAYSCSAQGYSSAQRKKLHRQMKQHNVYMPI